LNAPGALYPAESSLARPQDTLKGCARRTAAAGRQAQADFMVEASTPERGNSPQRETFSVADNGLELKCALAREFS